MAPSGLARVELGAVHTESGRARLRFHGGPPGRKLQLRLRLVGCCTTLWEGDRSLALDSGGWGAVEVVHGVPLPARATWLVRVDAEGPWTPEAAPNRIRGDFAVAASVWTPGRQEVPSLKIPSWSGPAPQADGILDEPGWRTAAQVELVDSMTGAAIEAQRRTRLRWAWTPTALLVAFEAQDPDVTERYRNRDDPIYRHEAVELFLMPNAVGYGPQPYVELQASPGGIRFDASFTGPRSGMRQSFDAQGRVGTTVQGTLRGRKDLDRGWVSEWVVPWSSLGTAPPVPSEPWRANAFRIDRSRGLPDGHQAWSPPRVGDFHRTERFGWLRFVP